MCPPIFYTRSPGTQAGLGGGLADDRATRHGTMATIHVTHSSLDGFKAELRLDLQMTVEQLKQKLVGHCGTEPQHQHLTLLDGEGVMVATLDEDSATLAAKGASDGYLIHVVDGDPHAVVMDLNDVSAVQKVEVTEEAAAARKAEFAAFKAKSKPAVSDEHLATEAAAFVVGSSCTANGKQATVRYVGKIPEIAPGWWVGVEYAVVGDGKHDGTVKDVRYFTCPANTGGVLRPDKLVA